MTQRAPFGSICRLSEFGSVGTEGPDFIRCVDVREPQIHEVWDFGSNGITCEFHPKERENISAGDVGAANLLAPHSC